MQTESKNRRIELIRTHIPGLEISSDSVLLESHGCDWSHFREPAPSAIVFPRSIEQVTDLVNLARERRIPLVPSGGRTGLSGGAIAVKGEVVVSFDHMRKIIEFNSVDRTLTVEPGVVTQTVQEYALQHGLFYPLSFAS